MDTIKATDEKHLVFKKIIGMFTLKSDGTEWLITDFDSGDFYGMRIVPGGAHKIKINMKHAPEQMSNLITLWLDQPNHLTELVNGKTD